MVPIWPTEAPPTFPTPLSINSYCLEKIENNSTVPIRPNEAPHSSFFCLQNLDKLYK
jgi:hypothetical protein